MSKIYKFEDINAWQKARQLVSLTYKHCKSGEFKNDYPLRDQIIRSGISIMANIAEGFARRSSKEFSNFLNIAHASVAEHQSHLYVALDLKYLKQEEFTELYNRSEEISRMLQGFSSYLRS